MPPAGFESVKAADEHRPHDGHGRPPASRSPALAARRGRCCRLSSQARARAAAAAATGRVGGALPRPDTGDCSPQSPTMMRSRRLNFGNDEVYEGMTLVSQALSAGRAPST